MFASWAPKTKTLKLIVLGPPIITRPVMRITIQFRFQCLYREIDMEWAMIAAASVADLPLNLGLVGKI